MAKNVTCDCGVSITEEDERSLIAAVKGHERRVHNRSISDDDVRAMMVEVE